MIIAYPCAPSRARVVRMSQTLIVRSGETIFILSVVTAVASHHSDTLTSCHKNLTLRPSRCEINVVFVWVCYIYCV